MTSPADTSQKLPQSTNLPNETAPNWINVEIKVPFTAIVIGSPGQGKTTLIKYLANFLIKKKKIDKIFAFVATAGLDSDYDYLPKKYLFGIDAKKIVEIMKLQETLGPGKRKQILLIFDDVVDAFDEEHKSLINKLFCNYRHYDLSIIIASQTITKSITPASRQNSKYWFITSHSSVMYKAIHPYVKGYNRSPADFCEFCDVNTRDQHILFHDKYRVPAEDETNTDMIRKSFVNMKVSPLPGLRLTY